jgi:hypothetical protein
MNSAFDLSFVIWVTGLIVSSLHLLSETALWWKARTGIWLQFRATLLITLSGLLEEWELRRSLGHPYRGCLTTVLPHIFFIVCLHDRVLPQLKCSKLQTAKAEFICMFTRPMKRIAFSQTMSFQQLTI